jgi:hypothetical protein
MGTPVKAKPEIVLTKVTNVGTYIGGISYTVESDGKDTSYDLSFNNYKYMHITAIGHIYFSGEGHALDSLHALMKTVFLEENRKNKDYMVTVQLGKGPISVGTYRTMGITACLIQNEEGYGLFTEKQVERLFGN